MADVDGGHLDEKTAILRYADAVREQHRLEELAVRARAEADAARDTRQERWRILKALKPRPGVYRVALESATHEEGMLIGTGDYPDVFPMFDAHRR